MGRMGGDWTGSWNWYGWRGEFSGGGNIRIMTRGILITLFFLFVLGGKLQPRKGTPFTDPPRHR